jgi:hypothetical protein
MTYGFSIVSERHNRSGPESRMDAPDQKSASYHDILHIIPGAGAPMERPRAHDPCLLASPDSMVVLDEDVRAELLANLEAQSSGTRSGPPRPDSAARAFRLSGRGRLLPDRSGIAELLLSLVICVVAHMG